MTTSGVGLTTLFALACAACSPGGDSPGAGAGGTLAAGSGNTGGGAGNAAMGGTSGNGSGGTAGVDASGNGGTSGDAAGTGAQVGQPDGSVITRPDYPAPVLSQTGRGCAIKADGTMTCWDDVLVDYPLNVIAGMLDAVYLETNWLADDLCAHLPGGGYSCFPLNSKIQPPADTDYYQIAIGLDEACGIAFDGTIECWGDPGVSSMPQGPFVQIDACDGVFCGVRSDGTGECWDQATEYHAFPSTERFRQVSASPIGACGITLDARVVCWGVVPIARTSDEPATTVSVDDQHACAVLEDGRAECFGMLRPGYQGPPADQRFRAIDAGRTNDCGITTERHVWCWGNDLPAREMLDGDGEPIVVMDW